MIPQASKMAEIILANATQQLSQEVKDIGTSLLSALITLLVGIVVSILGAVAAYIKSQLTARADRIEQYTEMRNLKAKQVKLHEENNQIKRSSTQSSPNPSP